MKPLASTDGRRHAGAQRGAETPRRRRGNARALFHPTDRVRPRRGGARQLRPVVLGDRPVTVPNFTAASPASPSPRSSAAKAPKRNTCRARRRSGPISTAPPTSPRASAPTPCRACSPNSLPRPRSAVAHHARRLARSPRRHRPAGGRPAHRDRAQQQQRRPRPGRERGAATRRSHPRAPHRLHRSGRAARCMCRSRPQSRGMSGSPTPNSRAPVDYITIHLLPYWEGLPVDDALRFILEKLDAVQAAYPDKHIVIGEVGWPSNGVDIGAAPREPGNQALFLRKFFVAAQHARPRLLRHGGVRPALEDQFRRSRRRLLGHHGPRPTREMGDDRFGARGAELAALGRRQHLGSGAAERPPAQPTAGYPRRRQAAARRPRAGIRRPRWPACCSRWPANTFRASRALSGVRSRPARACSCCCCSPTALNWPKRCGAV